MTAGAAPGDMPCEVPGELPHEVPLRLAPPIQAVCFDWGGTLMPDDGPSDLPMVDWPRLSVVDGALACLQALHGRLPLAIATNAAVSRRPQIEAALACVGLRGFFSQAFCYTELGCRKSEPAFWQAVQRTLGVPALQGIAMVGDSFEQDAAAPRRFGVQGVWFNPAGAPLPAGATAVPQVRTLGAFAAAVLRAMAEGR